MSESTPARDEAVGDEPATPAAAPASGIPDFVADAQTIASFESARERFDRGEAQAAEDEVRAGFQRKRDALKAEIAAAESIITDRENRWKAALEAYGRKYPKRVEKSKARPPGFFENLFSFGAAARLHAAVVDAAGDLTDARSNRRRKEHEEEDLEQQLKRSLGQLEESLRSRNASAGHQEKFLSRPGNQALQARVAAIAAERAAYAARLQRGEVPASEQRERRFAQLSAARLEAPFTGVAIVGVETYGDWCYLIFRDRERRHFYHEYDARLQPLSDAVFDVYRIADHFEAKFHRRDGKPMTLADHLTEFLRDDELAKSEARKIRATLREPRFVTQKDVVANASLIDLLAELAKTAGRVAGSPLA